MEASTYSTELGVTEISSEIIISSSLLALSNLLSVVFEYLCSDESCSFKWPCLQKIYSQDLILDL